MNSKTVTLWVGRGQGHEDGLAKAVYGKSMITFPPTQTHEHFQPRKDLQVILKGREGLSQKEIREKDGS